MKLIVSRSFFSDIISWSPLSLSHSFHDESETEPRPITTMESDREEDILFFTNPLVPRRGLNGILIQNTMPTPTADEQVPIISNGGWDDEQSRSRSWRPRRWELRRDKFFGGSKWFPGHIMEEDEQAAPSSTLPASISLPYTDEEYSQHLTLPDWSKEETDLLIQLCQKYNCRFAVVLDRYNCEMASQMMNPTPRLMEDIRNRYFSIMATIQSVRSGEVMNGISVASPYDREGDRRHRLNLESLFSREADALREEALLSEALSQLKLVLPEVINQRERLLLNFGGLAVQVLNSKPTLPELMGITRRKSSFSGGADAKRKDSNAASLGKPTGDGNAPKKSSKKKRPPPKPETLAGESTMSTPAGATVRAAPSHSGPGRKPKPPQYETYVRSSRLKPIRPGLIKHVDKLLMDAGLPLRPEIPTQAVCEKFDELRSLMVKMVELQRIMDQLTGAPPQFGSGMPSRADSASGSASRVAPTRPTTPGGGIKRERESSIGTISQIPEVSEVAEETPPEPINRPVTPAQPTASTVPSTPKSANKRSRREPHSDSNK